MDERAKDARRRPKPNMRYGARSHCSSGPRFSTCTRLLKSSVQSANLATSTSFSLRQLGLSATRAFGQQRQSLRLASLSLACRRCESSDLVGCASPSTTGTRSEALGDVERSLAVAHVFPVDGELLEVMMCTGIASLRTLDRHHVELWLGSRSSDRRRRPATSIVASLSSRKENRAARSSAPRD